MKGDASQIHALIHYDLEHPSIHSDLPEKCPARSKNTKNHLKRSARSCIKNTVAPEKKTHSREVFPPSTPTGPGESYGCLAAQKAFAQLPRPFFFYTMLASSRKRAAVVRRRMHRNKSFARQSLLLFLRNVVKERRRGGEGKGRRRRGE